MAVPSIADRYLRDCTTESARGSHLPVTHMEARSISRLHELTFRSRSVFRRLLFNVVDHEDLHGALSQLHFYPEKLVHRVRQRYTAARVRGILDACCRLLTWDSVPEYADGAETQR